MMSVQKAVVLLSGGVDSATVSAIAKHEGFEIHCLSFFYGQRHSIELSAAKRVANAIGAAKHLIKNIDLTNIVCYSALTDNIEVPKNRDMRNVPKEIPATYVPARNTIFLSYALALAEVIQSANIFIGVNAIDYSGYPDCRPEYISAFQLMANLATKAGAEGITKIKIRAPLINMTKAEIIKKGIELGVDYSLTHSCYDPSPDNLACGSCDSCLLRKQGFQEAGIADPIKYILQEQHRP